MTSIRNFIINLILLFYSRRTSYVFEKEYKKNQPVKKSKIPINIRLLTNNDVEEYRNIRESNMKADIAPFLKRGDLCMCAEYEKHIISYVWSATKIGILPEHHLRFKIPKKCIYLYNSYTLPKYRGLGVSTEVMAKMELYLIEQGFEKQYNTISPDNIPSIRTVEKNNHKKTGILNTIYIMGYKHHRVDDEDELNIKKIKNYFNI